MTYKPLTEAQGAEFDKLADAMIKYLNDNHNPHTKVIIDTTTAEIVGGERCYRTEKHWLD